ncbi:MAG: hypothetical protein JSS99_10570 [Actinobacteria bacterium]|nr:hypothetical protein [Actinomycetota bacterium]
MTRILLDPGAMLRTAGTLERNAGELSVVTARLAPDAATVMPPDLAADVAGTLARSGGRLGGVAARYGAEGARLAGRAVAAKAADADGFLHRALRVDSLVLDFLLSVTDRRFRIRSRAFPKGRFSFMKWVMGGRRWGYRNGIKSILRGDLEVLRGLARGSASTWRSVTSDARRAGAGVWRSTGRMARTVVGRGGRFTLRAAGRLALKAMVPLSLYEGYNASHARTPVGRATSAVLKTAAGFIPGVAIVDVVTDGAASDTIGGAFDVDVSAAEGWATHHDGLSGPMDAARRGDYGPLMQRYMRLVSGA